MRSYDLRQVSFFSIARKTSSITSSVCGLAMVCRTSSMSCFRRRLRMVAGPAAVAAFGIAVPQGIVSRLLLLSEYTCADRLLHRVQAEHVALGVVDEGHEAVLPDRELGLLHPPARLLDPRLFGRAVLADEVDQRAVAARGEARHAHQRTRRAGSILGARERPHLQPAGLELLELAAEDSLVERAGARHVLHVDLEPADRVVLHVPLPSNLPE